MPPDNLENTIDQFEEDWGQLTRPQVFEIFNRNRADFVTFLELVHTDFELRLKSGEAARVEEYLQHWPELNRVADELVLLELGIRDRREPYLTIDEFIERFPEFEKSLMERRNENTFKSSEEVSHKVSKKPCDRSYATDRFSMESLHAEGGLGNVWLAHDHELSRTVALKEIKNKFANHPELELRFHQEVAITGMLDHPGVVPIHSKGTFRDGRPYYTMRMIRGKSLNERVKDFQHQQKPRKHQPEFRRLLQHLVDACKTIEFAHSRGVIHRDIKPSNIMIGEYGETLVVDWGLAKVLSEETPGEYFRNPALESCQANSESTVVGQIIGSPAFMSPEQANGDSAKVDQASDIYSLGATLFYLIANQPRVLDPNWDPVRSRKSEDLPRQINPLLSICSKAMAWQPEERFSSAREIAEAIECFLDDSPVATYPETKFEMMERLIHRNQNVFRATVVAMVVIASISTVAAIFINNERKNATEQANEAKVQSKVANVARQQALSAKGISDELVGLLSDVFILSGNANRGLQFDFANHIAKFQASLERKEPLVQAKGNATLGQYFASSGKLEDAIRHFEDSLRIYKEFQPQPSNDYILTLIRLCQTYILANRNARAEAMENQIMEWLPQVESITSTTLMELYSLRSQIAGWKSDPSEGIKLARKALKLADDRMLENSEDESLVTIWLILSNRLVGQLINAGGDKNMEWADQYLTAASEVQKRYGHSETRAAITTLSNRGVWCRQTKRYKDFVENCRKVSELRKRLFGENDRETLKANSLLGSALLNFSKRVGKTERQAMLAEAVDVLEITLSKQVQLFGEGNSDAANTAVFLATAWRRQLDRANLENAQLEMKFSMLRKRIQANEKQFEFDNPLLLRLKAQLALLYQAAGRMQEATGVFEEVGQALEPLYADSLQSLSRPLTPKAMEIMTSCAAHFVAMGKYDESLGMLIALVSEDERKGKTTPIRNYMLGLCWLHCGEPDENEKLQMAVQRLRSACSGMALENRQRRSMPAVELNANIAFLRALQMLGDERGAKENLDLAIASKRLNVEQLKVLTAEFSLAESQ